MTLEVTTPWAFGDDQTIVLDGRKYTVHAAIKLAEDLPVRALPLADFNISYGSPCRDTLRNFVEHMKLVEDADLSYPIILNEDGAIIDGRHRLCKALLEGHETIRVQRFVKDPGACWAWD
jgi:L-ribulose-5-phosphate 3-epimerase UlaE